MGEAAYVRGGGGASRPTQRFPCCLRFCFRFSFWFTLHLNFPIPPPPSPDSTTWKKQNHETNGVWLKCKFRSWRSTLSKVHQNRSYPWVFFAISKFGKNCKIEPRRDEIFYRKCKVEISKRRLRNRRFGQMWFASHHSEFIWGTKVWGICYQKSNRSNIFAQAGIQRKKR